jgi:chloramphenicol-sensitive protein RarD
MLSSKHYTAAIASFVIWGFISFGLKPLHEYPSTDILFYRIFFCVGLMLFINLAFTRKKFIDAKKVYSGMPPTEKKKLILATAVSGLLLAANWFFFIYVMNHVSVKTASFAYLVCPILTTVLAFFILKEKLGREQWGAVALSVAGCVLLSMDAFQDIFYSLIVASTYALYLVIQKKITIIDRFLLLNIQLVIACLVLLPFFPSFSGPVPQEFKFYGYILIMAVVFTIIPLFLNLYALKAIKSSTVGILLYINPIIGFLLAAFYYGEEISAMQIIAYSLILISIFIFNIRVIFPKRTEAVQQ